MRVNSIQHALLTIFPACALLLISMFLKYSPAEPIRTSVVTEKTDVIEPGKCSSIEKLLWHPDKAFAQMLASLGKPIILQQSVGSTFTKHTIESISKLKKPKHINSFFKHTNNVFGPYYDSKRPMHALKSIKSKTPYETDVTLPVSEIQKVFSGNNGVYYSLSIDPLELGLDFNISEMISIRPTKTSVNIWLGMKDGTTPCHFDGYHNMYVQLSGSKRFTLYPPSSMQSLQVFPFLHPSYGQCKTALKDMPRKIDGCLEISLEEGEMLYIPPFWIHEVTGKTASVAVNVWTGIDEENIFEEILSVPIPGLSSTPYEEEKDFMLLENAFKPHFPLLNKELVGLPARLVLGTFLVYEIMHRTDIKAIGHPTLNEVHSRYIHIIEDQHLPGILPVIERGIFRIIETWVPKPPVLAPSVWGMSVADKPLGVELFEYCSKIAPLFRNFSSSTVDIWFANYIEYVAIEVAGLEKASWLIDILGRKSKFELARRNKKP